MASSLPSTSLFTPLIPLRLKSKFLSTTNLSIPKDSNFIISCSSSKSIPLTEQQVLQAIAESNDNTLPCVRIFENDLSQLTLVGAVDFDQALTAAAADGGQVATEHVNADLDAMVVETTFPGSSDNHSTVSTRLFLPARKVKEKAMKLRKSFSKDIFSDNLSRDILSMTFRQVVLQQLWNFDLVVFQPGEERKMEDLENPREVPTSFTLSSSSEYLISMIAEAICVSALQSTERQFLDDLQGGNRSGFFHWFQKTEKIQSKDSPVILYKLFEDEVVENARSLLDKYNSMKGSFKPVKIKSGHRWWKPSCHGKLDKIGGSDFSAWTNEYLPAYRLEIDSEIIGDAKIGGLKKSTENRWEVLLTHSQMVALAETLDMYYVDTYSLPDKKLSSGVPAKLAKMYTKKGSSSLSKLLSVTLASGIILVAISLGQIYLRPFFKERKHSIEHRSLPSSEVETAMDDFLDTTKSDEFCLLTVAKLKDAFGWSADIKVEDGVGAWIGKLPAYLTDEGADTLSSLENMDEDANASMLEISSYQVVFSSDGKIVGFQPLSKVGVLHWGANPLARELYGGKKLSPAGIIEPGLKIPLPRKIVVVELLMSDNPDAYFAVARPSM
ncbi:PREDICTED: uncharacterized protein LOC109330247 isoform X1 [Lupinus angustifolius]|uniref:uncharacterized protein LOC109330247 isoform X1 n=1 Tax=Lupinus angustifolius TaxID=3871 RepID=UPI00092EB2F4|nr:PREDICTED: uncharacterized protein LOC109330247 isoform X1 [Lupinus angustifolius]